MIIARNLNLDYFSENFQLIRVQKSKKQIKKGGTKVNGIIKSIWRMPVRKEALQNLDEIQEP